LLEDSSHFSVSNALVVKSSGGLNFSVINAGLWIRFSWHSPNFYSSNQKTTVPIYRNCQWEGKKPSPGWQVGLYFYSPILKSTRIWRVVIHIPVIM
jgi:hypothetical protein